MTNNRWLGVAQAKTAQQALQPINVSPGSVWILRVGSQSYSYTYPASIETDGLTDNDRAEVVCNGLVAAYSGGGNLGGGATLTVGSVTSEIYAGRWSVMVTGTSSGAPLDVELTGADPTAAAIQVVQLQAGRAAQNHIQRIKFPATPSSGNWYVRYKDRLTSALAYNISAGSLQTALEGLASIGSGNVAVSGSNTAGYTVEFQGSLAATAADALVAYSQDFAGVATYKIEKTVTGGVGRQTYTLPDLDGNAQSLYRFSYDGEQSHIYSGAATVDALTAALESIEIIGEGNVVVEEQTSGDYQITLIGEFVGLTGETLSTVNVDDGEQTDLDADEPTLTAATTVVVITILNMPYGGTFTLSYGGSTTGGITYTSATISTINSALSSASITAWTCTAASGDGVYSAKKFTLTSNSAGYDAGVILPSVASLVGCNAIDVRTTQQALVARNEVQQVSIAADPTGGTFTLSFDGQTTAGLAYNASASTIQTAFVGLSSVGSGNAVVSGPVGGPFIVEFQSSLGSAEQDLITGSAANLTLPSTADVTEIVVAVPTGPNWWTNAANWSLGSVPTSSDVAVFDAGTVDCVYGIASVAAVAGIDVYRSYGGRLGLPERKDDGSPETLQQYLSLSNGGGTIPIRIGLGDEGNGPSVIRIDTQSQSSQVTLLYSSQAGGDQTYTVGLAGLITTLHAADCSLQIAASAGLTATVTTLRVSPQTKTDDGAKVEWGEGATITTVEVVAGTVRGGKVPTYLTVHSGQVSLRGSTGTLKTLVLRNSRLRYLAGGSIGHYGSVSAMTTNGDNEARLTSASHGLVSGDRIFLRGVEGVVGLPDGVYTVLRVDSNTIDLVGTAPDVPYGAVDPTVIDDFYEANTAKWGLADAVRIGAGGVLDFSELSLDRTIIAPVLLQAADAQVIDTLRTVSGLRLKSDPGYLESTLGNQALVVRA